MPKRLSPNASLDTLKNTAKRWLKALRTGDDAARARLLAAYPKAPVAPVLRDVQHALALEYGHADWIALKAALADLTLGRLRVLDRNAAATLARAHPECLANPAPMIAAARKNRADVVALLLDLGMSPDVMDADELRGIQAAIQGNAPTVVKLLAERGADIDRPTKGVGGGALGFAAHFGHRDIAEILASRSRDAIHLAYLALADRLRELLAAEPKLANAPDPRYGIRPLFCLPDDEAQAADMAALLLAHGADPRLTSKEGETAEQVARKRGLDEAAELLRRT